MSLRLAIFDCDGTLVDSQGAIVSAMRATAAHHDHPAPAPEQIRRVVGLPLLEAVSLLFPDAGADALEQLELGYKSAFATARAKGAVEEPLYPGAAESLAYLGDAGWLLGVATGKSHRGLVATLGHHDLLNHFVTLQTADHAPGKPRPDMVYRALDETGVGTNDAVMIGDTTYDMLMARNAGVKAIGVSWGYHDGHELMDAGADMIVDDYGELLGALQAVLS